MHENEHAALISMASFFAGMLLFAVIDRLVPHDINPHHSHPHENEVIKSHTAAPPRRRLLRIGLLTTLVISAHNVPEGMVTFFSALHDPNLGLVIAVAIAVHNIPEGISVSVPVYYATGSRMQAFLTSLASALAEPIGALLGYAVLHNYLDGPVLGIVFALIAGMMVALSLDELLPFARKYSKGHETQYGIFCGMLMMALSLFLLQA
jgi:ZIP family zinc transporter